MNKQCAVSIKVSLHQECQGYKITWAEFPLHRWSLRSGLLRYIAKLWTTTVKLKISYLSWVVQLFYHTVPVMLITSTNELQSVHYLCNQNTLPTNEYLFERKCIKVQKQWCHIFILHFNSTEINILTSNHLGFQHNIAYKTSSRSGPFC